MIGLIYIAFLIFGYFEIVNGNWEDETFLTLVWILSIPGIMIYSIAKGIDGK